MRKPGWNVWLSIVFWFLAICILGLYLAQSPQGASDAYVYTIQVLTRFGLPVCVLVAFFLSPGIFPLFRTTWWLIVPACIFICIPVFSPNAGMLSWRKAQALSVCWLLGFITSGICLFVLGSRYKNFVASIFCLGGTICLCLAAGESFYLFTPQLSDGIYEGVRESKYILSNQAESFMSRKITPFGTFPAQPAHPSASVAQRDMFYGSPLFDVRYTYNSLGHRILPKASDNPEVDLLLFGCSFTFGHGLENEQTWAWQLATDLGPRWRLENYAFNAFGAQQMLTLLEENAIEEPTAPQRMALFLSIAGHINRHTGLYGYSPNSIAYELKNGELIRNGFTDDLPVTLIHKIPMLLNGSQLAREGARIFVETQTRRNHDHFADTYIAMLKKSGEILKQRYHTRLTILVWPDAEYLLPQMLQAGLNVLPIKPMLPQWDKSNGAAYHILANVETHPNSLAASQLAAGLAAWLKNEIANP